MRGASCGASPNRYNVATACKGGANKQSALAVFSEGWSMQRWFCWVALGVSGVMLLLFLLDLVSGIPFGGGFSNSGDYATDVTVVDIIGIIIAGILGYIGWNALRDIRT
jgi:hypothetical protein